jgi:hypothetical protein
MLQLLLDEHLSPRIVKQFLRKCPDARMALVLDWQDGRLTSGPDDLLLTEARRHQLSTAFHKYAHVFSGGQSRERLRWQMEPLDEFV